MTACMANQNGDFQVIAARGIVINGKNEVLVVSENGNKWHLPGGWIETLEDPMTGCEREVYEEVGMQIKAQKIIYITEFLQKPEPPYVNTVQKFDLYCYCTIVGNQAINHDWIDHDNELIKYRKFIGNDEWKNSDNIYAPDILKKIAISDISSMLSCYNKM